MGEWRGKLPFRLQPIEGLETIIATASEQTFSPAISMGNNAMRMGLGEERTAFCAALLIARQAKKAVGERVRRRIFLMGHAATGVYALRRSNCIEEFPIDGNASKAGRANQ